MGYWIHPATQSAFELGTLVKGIGIASLIRAHRSSIWLPQTQAKQNILRFYFIESWFRSENETSSIMFSFIAEIFFIKYFSKILQIGYLMLLRILDLKLQSISQIEKNREYDWSYLCMYLNLKCMLWPETDENIFNFFREITTNNYILVEAAFHWMTLLKQM